MPLSRGPLRDWHSVLALEAERGRHRSEPAHSGKVLAPALGALSSPCRQGGIVRGRPVVAPSSLDEQPSKSKSGMGHHAAIRVTLLPAAPACPGKTP